MLTLRSITQERAAMNDPRFGYDYPAGAETDDLAPWNEGFSDADFEEDYQADEEED